MNLINQNTSTGISFNSIYHKHIFNSITVLKVERITNINPEDTFSPIYFFDFAEKLEDTRKELAELNRQKQEAVQSLAS